MRCMSKDEWQSLYTYIQAYDLVNVPLGTLKKMWIKNLRTIQYDRRRI